MQSACKVALSSEISFPSSGHACIKHLNLLIYYWFPKHLLRQQHTKMFFISPMRCENVEIFSFRLIFILLCQFISVAVGINCLLPLFFTIFRNRSELVHINKSACRLFFTCVPKVTYTKMFVQNKGTGDCYCATHSIVFSYFSDDSLLPQTLIRCPFLKKLLKIPRKYLIVSFSKAQKDKDFFYFTLSIRILKYLQFIPAIHSAITAGNSHTCLC